MGGDSDRECLLIVIIVICLIHIIIFKFLNLINTY